MRSALYAHLLRLSFGFYDRHQTGQLMSRATVDLQTVRFFLGYGLIFFFQNALTLVGAAAVMFVVNWKLTLVALWIAPLLIGLAYRYSHVAHPLLRDVQQKMADVATVAEENIVGVHVVKSFAQEHAEQAKFERSSEAVFRQSVAANRQRALYVPLLSFLPLLAQAAVILVGGRMVIDGTLTYGAFFSFNIIVLMMVMPLRMLGMWIGQAQRATASGERIFEILDEPEEVADRPGAVDLPPGPGRVEYRDVHFEYAPGRPVAARDRPRARAGEHDRADRAHRRGQDDARRARRTLLRRQRRRRPARRGRRARRDDPFAAACDRRRLAGSVPLLRDCAREHRVRRRRRDRRGDRARRRARPGARVHRTASGRLRHADRRARDHALGRPAPAARDRARADRRPARADPRRRDCVCRRDDRGADQARPARGDARPHDDHHRAPALDDLARGRHRRARRRRDRRARDARGAARDEPRLPRHLRARPARAGVRLPRRGDRQ